MTRPALFPPVHFAHPPVVEVVCGVAFDPIPELASAHFGVLWGQFADEFPLTTDQHPLRLVPDDAEPGVQVNLGVGQPTPRVWFLSEDEGRLIQVQRDRFHYNWRLRADGEAYPRYPKVYEDFKKYLAVFRDFLEKGGVAPLKPLQYELSYVNRIAEDAVWSGPQQVGRVFPDLGWRDTDERFLPGPDFVAAQLRFPMPEGAGRLYANIAPVRRKETGAREFALDLTARGAAGTRPVDEWFELAHEWITQGFADLTGEQMHHKAWKRTEAP